MRKVEGISAAAFFSLVLSTVACASPPNASDEQIIDSMQTVQLIPNTHEYSLWASWIRDEIGRDTANYHDFRNGQFVPKIIPADVDLITLRTTLHTPDTASGSASHAHATVDEKPVSLPVSGEPGEHITIVSQTTNIYLSWTYVWNIAIDGGRGGWELTGNSFHDCRYMSNRTAGSHCEGG